MATWERNGEWRGYDWEMSASARRWPNWGLGLLVHRSRFSLIAVWLMLGPLEAWLDIQLPIPCRSIENYIESDLDWVYFDEEEQNGDSNSG
ncbi:MAG: hypothetical protein WC977_12580 [Anaerovoracaceae bacterium]|jgi:hypothetical protein